MSTRWPEYCKKQGYPQQLLIVTEYRFYRLFELCDLVERTVSYAELPLKRSNPPKPSNKPSHKKEMTVHFEKDLLRNTPSLPSTPIPVLNECKWQIVTHDSRFQILEGCLLTVHRFQLKNQHSRRKNGIKDHQKASVFLETSRKSNSTKIGSNSADM